MSESRDIRESVTVEFVGTLFGRDVFVPPFETGEEREHWRLLVATVFGPPLRNGKEAE